jgi:type IV secretion system protein VirD4
VIIVSRIYDKFINNARNAYAVQSSFERELSSYNLSTGVISKPSIGLNALGGPLGGVPLSFNDKKNSVFVDPSDSHTLIMGSTGSKKSRLIAMPAIKILTVARESMIISDPKGELYSNSADALKEAGYALFVFNLRDPDFGDCWNPLYEPYRYYRNGEVNKACELINDVAITIARSLENFKDPFWPESAISLFFGLSLLLLKYCKEHDEPDGAHIGNVVKLRQILFNEGKQINTGVWDIISRDNIIGASISGSNIEANNTRAGILSTFDQMVRMFFLQPNLVNALAFNDIDWMQIYEKPTACFIIMPDEKTTYNGLVALFIKQSYEKLIDIYSSFEKTKKQNVRVNYILDEFSSLPKINDFPAMISAARSRNIRFNLIMQSYHQLQSKYEGEAETVQDNCINWVFLHSRELKLLDNLSHLCGNYWDSGSYRQHIKVEDLQRLDKKRGEALILRGREKPYIATLPDIKEYANKKYIAGVLEKRDVKQNVALQFDEYNESKTDNVFFSQMNDLQTDRKNCNRTMPGLVIGSDDKKTSDDLSATEKTSFWGTTNTSTETNKDNGNLSIIEEYSFPSKYHSTNAEFHFSLIAKASETYITDNGLTMEMLDNIFELKEPDVIKNLVAAMREFKAIRRGTEFLIVVNKEATAAEIDEAKFRLFSCVSFMNAMRIFYI